MHQHIPVVIALLLALQAPAQARHKTTLQTCTAYTYTETYRPGRITADGRYKKGKVRTKRRRTACIPLGRTAGIHNHPYKHL